MSVPKNLDTLSEVYAQVPKEVWAAVAANYLTSGGQDNENLVLRLLQQWDILRFGGVVAAALSPKMRKILDATAPKG